jgi:integrase
VIEPTKHSVLRGEVFQRRSVSLAKISSVPDRPLQHLSAVESITYGRSTHALPLNATAVTTLQALYNERIPDCPFVFAHANGRRVGEPVQDVKNAFHTALETAGIKDFTWHDLRHTFASWLMMKGASLRAVAELLGHRGLRMVMRYAHLSPAYLSSEVGLLDDPPPPQTDKGQKTVNSSGPDDLQNVTENDDDPSGQ